jgi:hypothetical protein
MREGGRGGNTETRAPSFAATDPLVHRGRDDAAAALQRRQRAREDAIVRRGAVLGAMTTKRSVGIIGSEPSFRRRDPRVDGSVGGRACNRLPIATR